MLNNIGFFQLDNLIKSRIPFFFINMGPSLVSWYTSIYKMHVETYEILAQPEQALSAVEEKKIPKVLYIEMALALDVFIFMNCILLASTTKRGMEYFSQSFPGLMVRIGEKEGWELLADDTENN